MLLVALLACSSADLDSQAAPPWGALTVPDGPDVPVSGFVVAFTQDGGRIDGATVHVVEHPDIRVTTDDDGRFDLGELPRGELLTFELSHPDYVPIRTGTFLMGHPDDGGDALTDLSFQVPSPEIYELMEQAAELSSLNTRCQIATTVTRRGKDLHGSGTHGEPGATATLTPAESETGPIYFDLVQAGLIWPAPELTETSHDGGVLWGNVPPGDYLMQGFKDGAEIRPVKIRCAAGYLMNASPSWGLQVTAGGMDPSEPGHGE